MPSLATFNANNFFLRYRFADAYPGDRSRKSKVEAQEVATGYLPGIAAGKYAKGRYVVWDAARRKLVAQALKAPDNSLPDILCFQEVENIQAIRILNQRYLGETYGYSLLIDGYDPRNIDVGVLSRFPTSTSGVTSTRACPGRGSSVATASRRPSSSRAASRSRCS